VALPDFFSNKQATDDEKSAIEAPTLSLTKVQATIGTLIVAIAGAAAKLEGPTAVKVAAIGAGALIMVGVFILAAVDLIARQRAEEAKLRWAATPTTGGAAGNCTPAKSPPAVEAETFEIKFGPGDDEVTVIAHSNGKSVSSSVQRPT
jgi:hypothetical protein